MRGPVTAYIGLGSNLGDRELTLRGAIAALDSRERIAVVDVSPLVETAPVGGPPQGPYLNGAAALRTDLGPRELLEALHCVEQMAGRERAVRWGPRTLDLDLLLYGEMTLDEPDLRVPHPLMHRRLFVLEPLSAIAPEAVHPVLGKTVRQLLRDLRAELGSSENCSVPG